MKRPPSSQRYAFTRIDLAIVLIITLAFVSLLPAQVQKVREAAARASCQANLHNIGVGIHNYAGNNNDTFPPMLNYSPRENMYWKPFWFSLCPELEQSAIYRRAQFAGGGWANDNHKAAIKLLLCPSDPSHNAGICSSGATGWAGTSYAPVYQLFGESTPFVQREGIFVSRSKYTMSNLSDQKGNSNQVGVVERFTSFPRYGWSNATFYPMNQVYWGYNAYGSSYGAWGLFPPQTEMSAHNAHPYYPNTGHTTMQALLMDGSVRPVSGSVDAKTWRMACDPEDPTPIPADW